MTHSMQPKHRFHVSARTYSRWLLGDTATLARLMYQAGNVARDRKVTIILADEESLVDFYRVEAPRARRATLPFEAVPCQAVI